MSERTRPNSLGTQHLGIKIREYFEKKRNKPFLQGRSILTTYEKEQLIPELKSRLTVLAQYFKDIIRLCDIQRDLGNST